MSEFCEHNGLCKKLELTENFDGYCKEYKTPLFCGKIDSSQSGFYRIDECIKNNKKLTQ